MISENLSHDSLVVDEGYLGEDGANVALEELGLWICGCHSRYLQMGGFTYSKQRQGKNWSKDLSLCSTS